MDVFFLHVAQPPGGGNDRRGILMWHSRPRLCSAEGGRTFVTRQPPANVSSTSSRPDAINQCPPRARSASSPPATDSTPGQSRRLAPLPSQQEVSSRPRVLKGSRGN